jgi:hypothetical protein
MFSSKRMPLPHLRWRIIVPHAWLPKPILYCDCGGKPWTFRGNTVELSWGAASDKLGVSSDAVWRNNAQIGGTTGTGYTDGSTTSGVTYT